jgi:putative ABC transport system ATP-binding protein
MNNSNISRKTKLSTSSDSNTSVTPRLKAIEVSRRFRRSGSADDVLALDAIDVEVERGTVVAIVGSNGAGKSTFLSVIAGSLLPTGGRIEVDGEDVTEMPSWRRSRVVARVRQDPTQNVFGALTIEENFALRRAGANGRFSLARASSRKVREEARAALRVFGMGLEDRLDDLAQTLSGGQRQAVAVAMAAAVKPQILLLDEYVAALDPKSARAVSEHTLNSVREQGITTLMVTHDMNHALTHSDRLLMFHRGQIVMSLSAEEKESVDVPTLVERFEHLAGGTLGDRALLT